MDVRKLECFLDLSKTGSYSETAERLFLSQSSVSKQILSLEKELNTALFDRSHKKVRLTSAGEAILEDAGQIVFLNRKIKQTLAAFSNAKKQILSIHAVPVMAQYHVTELLSEFCRENPDILLQTVEVEKTDLEKNLDKNFCDIIFTRIFETDIADYETVIIDKDYFTAVLPISHALSRRKQAALIELKDEPFLLPDEQTGLLECVCGLCRKSGFKPKIAYKGIRIDTILDMVSNEMGITILMEKTADTSRHPGIVKIPLDITMESRLAFARKKKNHYGKAEQAFWTYLTQKPL